jgi:hypothetical protein
MKINYLFENIRRRRKTKKLFQFLAAMMLKKIQVTYIHIASCYNTIIIIIIIDFTKFFQIFS